uniref:Uncharacterized protein n=1 Tax=Anguilla anguilla TaxID=7936 RepID=A0A0E9USM5_ANGAN
MLYRDVLGLLTLKLAMKPMLRLAG